MSAFAVEGATSMTGEALRAGADPHAASIKVLNIAKSFASIPAMPLEYVLRPHFGTRVIPPVTWFLGTTLANGVNFVGMALSLDSQAKTIQATGSVILYLGFMILTAWHAWRLWVLMLNIPKEDDSEVYGLPLPFFTQRPGPKQYLMLRCLIEPAVAFTAALLLGLADFIHPIASGFYMLASVALSFKCYCTWFLAWHHWRDLADRIFRAKHVEEATQIVAREQNPSLAAPAVATQLVTYRASLPYESRNLYDQMAKAN